MLLSDGPEKKPREAPRFRVFFAATLLAAALILPTASPAAPVYTVLTGTEVVGSERFLDDLSALWRRLPEPVAGRLAVTTVSDPVARLRRLGRGRGHFAIVDTPTAVGRLQEYPRLVAIGLLWPEYLHVLAAGTRAKELRLPLPGRLRIAPSARYVYDGLLEWSQDKPKQKELLKFVEAPDLAAGAAKGGILIFSAPAPDAQVAASLAENPQLKLLGVSPSVLEELRLRFPWLQTARLPRNTYPGVRTRPDLPVRHLVMVGRRDLAEEVVSKMLRTLYRRTRAVAPFNPLFASLNPKLNAVFEKLIPFHSVSAKEFRFSKRPR